MDFRGLCVRWANKAKTKKEWLSHSQDHNLVHFSKRN